MEDHILINLNTLFIILEKSTLVDLETNTINNLPTKKRQYATDPVQLTGLRITPFIGTKGLLFKGTAVSGGKTYTPIIMFNGVTFQDSSSADNITFKASDNQEYSIKQLPADTNTVQVRCDCLDFRWRFNMYNAGDKSLYGRKAGSYQKKTDKVPVNPAKVPGMCKHLLKMGQMLHQTKFTK